MDLNATEGVLEVGGRSNHPRGVWIKLTLPKQAQAYPLYFNPPEQMFLQAAKESDATKASDLPASTCDLGARH